MSSWWMRTLRSWRISGIHARSTIAAEFEPGDADTSVNLNVLGDLHFRMNGRGVPLSELTCELSVLRERVVPAMLTVLAAQEVTLELIESLGPLVDDVEDELCSGS